MDAKITTAILSVAAMLVLSGCSGNKKASEDESVPNDMIIVEDIIEDSDVIDMDEGSAEAVMDGYKDGEERGPELRTQEYAVRAEIQRIQEEARKSADDIVVGVVTGGSEISLSLSRLENGSNMTFSYPDLERDKIGNWYTGDTVMVYLQNKKVIRVRIIGKVPRDM